MHLFHDQGFNQETCAAFREFNIFIQTNNTRFSANLTSAHTHHSGYIKHQKIQKHPRGFHRPNRQFGHDDYNNNYYANQRKLLNRYYYDHSYYNKQKHYHYGGHRYYYNTHRN